MHKIIDNSYHYRVELLVDDGNDNANFVLFDREMLKLTKQDAAALTLDEVCNFLNTSLIDHIQLSAKLCTCPTWLQLQMNVGGGEELPQCLKELAGKYFYFRYV